MGDGNSWSTWIVGNSGGSLYQHTFAAASFREEIVCCYHVFFLFQNRSALYVHIMEAELERVYQEKSLGAFIHLGSNSYLPLAALSL